MLSFFLFLVKDSAALAFTPSPTNAVASPSSDMSRIEKIKEMVAQKVASLRLVEKKGVFGIVRETSTTQLTLVNKNNEERIIDVDELTKFQDPTVKSFGVSDIEKEDVLSVIGLYNKDSKRLLARFITRVVTHSVYLDGIVADKDRVNFTVTVANAKGEKSVVSIETTTKTQEYQKGDGMKKSGYSRINIGERVLVYGFPDKNKKEEIIATRIVRLVDIPPSAAMKQYQQVVNPSGNAIPH